MATRIPRSAVEKMALCQEIIGYRFNNVALLHHALNVQHHQRLGVLGDLVARVVVMDRWYEAERLTPRDWAVGVSSCLSNANLTRIGIRKGLAMCIMPSKPTATERNKSIADTVEAILGAVYKDAIYDGESGVRKDAGFQVLEGVVDRLGITSQLLISHSSRAWMLWQVKTDRVLGTNYFDGHHRQLMSAMDFLSDKGQPISLPRDVTGHFTGHLPLNQALLARMQKDGHVIRGPGIWQRLSGMLWRGRRGELAPRDKPQVLRRLRSTPKRSPSEPVASLLPETPKEHLAKEEERLRSLLEKQAPSILLSSPDGQQEIVAPTSGAGERSAGSQVGVESADDLLRELEEARRQLDESRSKASRSEEASGALQEELEKLNAKNSAMGLRLNAREIRIADLRARLRVANAELDKMSRGQLEVPLRRHDLQDNQTKVAKIDNAQAAVAPSSPSARPVQDEVTETFVEFIDRTTDWKLPQDKARWPSWLDRTHRDLNLCCTRATMIGNDPEAWYERGKALLSLVDDLETGDNHESHESHEDHEEDEKELSDGTVQESFEEFINRTLGPNILSGLPKSAERWPNWLARKRRALLEMETGNGQELPETISSVEVWHREAHARLRKHLAGRDDGTFESFMALTVGMHACAVPSGAKRWSWLAKQYLVLKKAEEKDQLPGAVLDVEDWYESAKARLLDEETLPAYVQRTTGDKLPFGKVPALLADPKSDWQKILQQWRSHLEQLQENNKLPKGVNDVDEWVERAETLLNKERGQQDYLF